MSVISAASILYLIIYCYYDLCKFSKIFYLKILMKNLQTAGSNIGKWFDYGRVVEYGRVLRVPASGSIMGEWLSIDKWFE